MTSFEVAVVCLLLLFCVTNMAAHSNRREGGANPMWYLLAVGALVCATVGSLINTIARLFR